MDSLTSVRSVGDHNSQNLRTKSGNSAVGWAFIEMLKTETHHVYGDLAVAEYPL